MRVLLEVKREEVLDKLAAVDWSRSNPAWFDIKLGDVEVDKMTPQTVTDEAGQPQVALMARAVQTLRSRLT
jgi:hypothetical protein